MINRTDIKNLAPEQAPEVRINNFNEVAGGFDEAAAVREAMRCLKCRTKPCQNKGCPAKMYIPEFIAKVAEGDYEAAYEIVCRRSALPSICSRVCPHENQCEGSCTCGVKGQPVAIGKIERFITDYHFANNAEAPKAAPAAGHKVCIIGAGPAGLSCAKDLAVKGIDVTVYESYSQLGGVMVYGIPQFRLEKNIIERETDALKAMGVKFVTGMSVGKEASLEDLMAKEGFEACFIGIGATVATGMGIPGEKEYFGQGVCDAQEYLKRVTVVKVFGDEFDAPYLHAKKVVVVGGGNVAMDASRTAKRLGADVTIVYRRSHEESPAAKAEIHEAQAEGINFCFLNNPISIKADAKGQVCAVECLTQELGAPDESGRRSPHPVEGSEHDYEADCVIMAIGNKVDKADCAAYGVEVDNRWGTIVTDETTYAGKHIYAGGDVVSGPDTVVRAMRAGRDAAEAILKQFGL